MEGPQLSGSKVGLYLKITLESNHNIVGKHMLYFYEVFNTNYPPGG